MKATLVTFKVAINGDYDHRVIADARKVLADFLGEIAELDISLVDSSEQEVA